MSSTTRKPPPSGNPNRRSQPPILRSDNRSPTPMSSPALVNPNGLARRNTIREGGHRPSGSISSPLSARSAVKTRPLSNDETEFENVAILEDLRSRLSKSESAAEAAAEEYMKQIKALQSRLGESQADYVRMEDVLHAKDEAVENLEMQIKDLTRSKRDQENIYEAERIAAQQEKEEMLDREEDLNAIIQRLKDTLSQRQPTPDREERDRRGSFESGVHESVEYAPSGNSPVSPNSLVLQKDKIIEALRFDLAESQIRLAEVDHRGGAQLQTLEQQLLELKMTNARLIEDNESFQLMLTSASLNGDFRGDYLSNAFSDPDPEPESNIIKKVQGSPRNSMSLGLNLAEELGEIEEETADTEKVRKLEAETKQLREQNKAMSLYINNIIERILQHKDSEAILDKTTPLDVSEKPLPPKPQEEQPTGILQRTKSLATRKKSENTGNTGGGLWRSQSLHGQNRHQRSQSDAGAILGPPVVGNLYRGEGMITPRSNTFYGGITGEHYTRSSRPRDSSASVDSGVSDTNTTVSSVSSSSHPPAPMGPIAGNKLRPLTLVQKNVNNGVISPTLSGPRRISGDYMDHGDEGKSDKKQSKRGSWMGWFNRGKEEGAPGVAQSVVFEGKDVE